MIVEERRPLATSAERVVAFFEHLDRHYLEWHPDHIAFVWIDGDHHDAFRFDETIGRWRIAMRMRIVRTAGGRHVTCRPISPWLRLVAPWMSFDVSDAGEGSLYVHRIKLRLGPLRPLLRKTLLNPLRRHMREESAYLDRLGRAPVVA